MPMTPPRLEMTGITKRFGATVALDGVDLTASAGRVVGLVGENGAGKSTLMKVLSGAIRADAGAMRLDGRPYAPADPLAGRRAGVAMIYQELSIVPHLSVVENVMLGVEPTTAGAMRWRAMHAAAREALVPLGRGEMDLTRAAGRLSVGEQQAVEIARALVVGARVLVFDEPTSSLGREDALRLFGLIDRLRERGLAVVYISHFLEEVRRVADDVVVLRDGRSVGGGAVDQLTDRGIIRLMVGRDVNELYPRTPRTPGRVVLELDALAGRIKPREASLTLRRGEVLGIAGLVGAGRTELLRAVFGLDPIVSGRVALAGFTGAATPTRRWRQGVGMLSEDRKAEGLALEMSVGDNLTLSRLEPLGPLGAVLPARQDAAARAHIERLTIRCRGPRQAISGLSGGNQQKVALARLLHHGADVLLLDEPTRGIDVGSKATIYRLIDDLARQGKAILLVSSYLPELLGVADRIAVMRRGVLGAAREVGAWDEQQLIAEAIGSEAA